MPLIKATTATATNSTTPTYTQPFTTTSAALIKTPPAIKTTSLAKSVPVTPVQPKPATNFPLSSPESVNNYAYMPHSYPNFQANMYDYSDEEDELDLDEDSSLAMITPPPPYDTPHHAQHKQNSVRRAASATQNAPTTRKFLFQNREIFSMSTTQPTTPSSSFASAITPTKLSAAAAAMFATPQMAQLNRRWKRHRRNSSSGDSKELDKLVLQSVDWDENDIY